MTLWPELARMQVALYVDHPVAVARRQAAGKSRCVPGSAGWFPGVRRTGGRREERAPDSSGEIPGAQDPWSVSLLAGLEVSAVKDTRTHMIYERKTGRAVALIDADGTLSEEGDPQAIAQLHDLLQRELVVRDRRLGFGAEDEDEGYEPFPERSMCYFGMVTLRPGDPEYLPAFLQCLPALSSYEARAVQE